LAARRADNERAYYFVGCGPKTEALLKNAGVTKVKDLRGLSRAKLLGIVAKGVTEKKLVKLVEQAKTAKAGNYDSVKVDHTKAQNPYLSRFGKDWETHMRHDIGKEGKVCITDLVEHCIQGTAAVMRGTPHEDDFLFYHDALNQMKDKKTKEWMEKKGFLKRWVLPLNGLNKGGRYDGRPIGNSPELMPLDCSLFKDVDFSMSFHIALTSWLPPNHPEYAHRFSRATPALSRSSYMRILDPMTGVAPSSDRIVQDVQRCWTTHLRQIYEAKGAIVPGIGNRNGRRTVTGLVPRGGKRVKRALGTDPRALAVHADALRARDLFVNRARVRVHEEADEEESDEEEADEEEADEEETDDEADEEEADEEE